MLGKLKKFWAIKLLSSIADIFNAPLTDWVERQRDIVSVEGLICQSHTNNPIELQYMLEI